MYFYFRSIFIKCVFLRTVVELGIKSSTILREFITYMLTAMLNISCPLFCSTLGGIGTTSGRHCDDERVESSNN